MRVDAEQKALLERAASLNGQTLSAFVLASARRAAEQTIRDHDEIRLSVRDAEAFVAALLEPTLLPDPLRRALERRRAVLAE